MDPQLLHIIACPKCQGRLDFFDHDHGLVCQTCEVIYPVVEEIPVLLIEEAISVEDWRHGKRPCTQKQG